MKIEKKISTALAAASAALISGGVQAEDTHDVGDWDVSAAILFYQESDDRVQAIEPIITAIKHLDTDETLSFKLTIDSLTGASPTGAVPSNVPQTFTKPSGKGDYVTGASTYPIDDTFLDTRVALSTTWDTPLAEDWRMSLNGNLSNEYDYQSISVGSLFAYDTNNKNTTYSSGISLGFDNIDPVGGVPLAFAQMTPAGATKNIEGGGDSKTLVDLLFGVTQVIDKHSLFQFNYSLSQSNGYLNDPYKIISVVDSNGIPLAATDVTGPSTLAANDLPYVVYENRPDLRTKHAFYGQYKRWMGGDVLDASYRLMIDDWGITSHTIDARYRWKFNERMFLQPHVRLYQQSEADFYTPFFVDGAQPVAGSSGAEASPDTRLSEFTAYTVGLELGVDNEQNSWSVALEYYLQAGNEPSGKFGELSNQELVPDVDAVMFRVIYDF